MYSLISIDVYVQKYVSNSSTPNKKNIYKSETNHNWLEKIPIMSTIFSSLDSDEFDVLNNAHLDDDVFTPVQNDSLPLVDLLEMAQKEIGIP